MLKLGHRSANRKIKMNQRSAAVILQDNTLTPGKAVVALDPTGYASVFSKEGTFGTYFSVAFDGTDKFLEPIFGLSIYDARVNAQPVVGAGSVILIEKLHSDGITLSTIATFVATGVAWEIIPLTPQTVASLGIDSSIGEAIKISSPTGIAGNCQVRIYFEK